MEQSFNTEKRNVDNQRATEKDDKLQNTLSLKLKRVETTLKEFQLLHFHVNSARIFFHVSMNRLVRLNLMSFYRLTASPRGWMMRQKAPFLELSLMLNDGKHDRVNEISGMTYEFLIDK